MSIEEIARTVKLYAHSNRSNPDFFRLIENELFERELDVVNYRVVGTLLEGFSHSNLGSATLYNSLANTIKIAQHEIHPLELAKYAFYFSKTNENIKGGFGVYKIAEDKLKNILEVTDFEDIIKIVKYFVSQNIGSNAFLELVEKSLMKQYPGNDMGGIPPGYLVKLIKYTSKHYFQYNDKALFHKLEADAIKLIPFLTSQQVLTILWSYSRARRGSLDLYKKLEERILEIGIEKFQSHYLVKILTGMNIRNAFQSLNEQLLTPILKYMKSQIGKCKYSEALNFLYTLVEVPPYHLINEDGQRRNIQEEYDKLFVEFEYSYYKKAQYKYKIDETCQIYYAFCQNNFGSSSEFLSFIEQQLTPTSIPKPYFAKIIYSFTQHMKFSQALPLIPIIKELMKYGDIKYFFSHEDYIRICWSSLLLEQTIKNSQEIDQHDEDTAYLKNYSKK
ncbi:hypothetical protein IMG5_106540 [Ichthyophthirius multifiliis]|uniref:Uncharacterized protein n=1 Tax=Ichthyophthirius multifiliis TaxID=5932 RepID=G0QT76_ICHMU|nr:hypothetical protein IMG5_106540 [Ichthyophthirius multifiliis]EGR31601.1 hypothetical protein IMG5_106540 [Ichthyophthirius multifiliis]|eukprot:XP_004035087.1 hypothetical protein IMG5_106540 [Ichthyophthirius multifiliis]